MIALPTRTDVLVRTVIGMGLVIAGFGLLGWECRYFDYVPICLKVLADCEELFSKYL